MFLCHRNIFIISRGYCVKLIEFAIWSYKYRKRGVARWVLVAGNFFSAMKAKIERNEDIFCRLILSVWMHCFIGISLWFQGYGYRYSHIRLLEFFFLFSYHKSGLFRTRTDVILSITWRFWEFLKFLEIWDIFGKLGKFLEQDSER